MASVFLLVVICIWPDYWVQEVSERTAEIYGYGFLALEMNLEEGPFMNVVKAGNLDI